MAANNKYDAEYIRYFAGVDALYIPSYCGYASKAQYSPVKGKPRPPCYNDPTSTLSPLPSTSTLYPYPLPLPSTPTLYPLNPSQVSRSSSRATTTTRAPSSPAHTPPPDEPVRG